MIAPPSPPLIGLTADTEDSTERPSKTRRKRDMTELQKLGERLLALSADQRARIDLPEALREALAQAARINSHEARRRQLQYVGRLMRGVDAEPIRHALDNATGASKAAVALMHRCEHLRDRLLDDDAALTAFLAEFPDIDAQPLRAMIRAARRERERALPPTHARELYRWLHELLQSPQRA
jgi:ribosome-associated protein